MRGCGKRWPVSFAIFSIFMNTADFNDLLSSVWNAFQIGLDISVVNITD